MIDPSRRTDRHADPDREKAGGIPRGLWWVGLIGGVMIVLYLVMHLLSGGLGGHVPRPHSFDLNSGGLGDRLAGGPGVRLA